MNDHQRMVKEFMTAFGQNTPEKFSVNEYPFALRASLIEEEAREFVHAASNGNPIEMIDAMCDLLYVTYGAAVAMGIDLEPFFSEVHRSNMSKLGEDGKPIYRSDGKVIKPAHWSPPDLPSVLRTELGLQYTPEVPDAAS